MCGGLDRLFARDRCNQSDDPNLHVLNPKQFMRGDSTCRAETGRRQRKWAGGEANQTDKESDRNPLQSSHGQGLTIFVWRAHEQPDGPGKGGRVGGASGELGEGDAEGLRTRAGPRRLRLELSKAAKWNAR